MYKNGEKECIIEIVKFGIVLNYDCAADDDNCDSIALIYRALIVKIDDDNDDDDYAIFVLLFALNTSNITV